MAQAVGSAGGMLYLLYLLSALLYPLCVHTHTHHTHPTCTHTLQGKSRAREKWGHRIGWDQVNGWWRALVLVLVVLLVCVLCLLIAAGNLLLLRDGITIRQEEVYRCQMLSMAAGYMGAWSEVVAYSGAIDTFIHALQLDRGLGRKGLCKCVCEGVGGMYQIYIDTYYINILFNM